MGKFPQPQQPSHSNRLGDERQPSFFYTSVLINGLYFAQQNQLQKCPVLLNCRTAISLGFFDTPRNQQEGPQVETHGSMLINRLVPYPEEA